MEKKIFEQVQIQHDDCPIYLIDKSYSTSEKYEDGNVLTQEIKLMTKDLEHRNIEKIFLMFWDSNASIASKDPIEVSKINKYSRINPGTSTRLERALSALPSSWIKNNINTSKDLYIYTDGELNGDIKRTAELIKQLISDNEKLRIHIVTIENNNVNYGNDDCNVGNVLFSLIQNNQLTKKLTSLRNYNMFHKNGYTNFYNPKVPDGFVPFRDKCFRLNKTIDFINYLEEEVSKITENTQEMSRLIYDLTLTTSSLCKNKNYKVQKDIINLISSVFKNLPCYREVREGLQNEIQSFNLGKGVTYQQYRQNRNKFVEKAQTMLYEDTKNSITNVPNEKYISFPITMEDNRQCIFICLDQSIDNDVKIHNKVYRKSAVLIDNHTIPMIPKEILPDDHLTDQCLRQWIRAIYSKRYNLSSVSDTVLYLFLLDCLRIYLSNISEEVTQTYRNLALLMLNKKKFGTELTELEYLSEGNAPLDIEYIYRRYDIPATIIWNGIVSFLDNIKLSEGQEKYLQSPTIYTSCDTLLMYLREKLDTNIFEFNYNDTTQVHEYYCYISLDNTFEEGGYAIKKHDITSNIVCNPRYVISEDSYHKLKDEDMLICPICNKKLDVHSYYKVPNKKDREALEKENVDKERPNIKEQFLDVSKHEHLKITKEMYEKEYEDTLLNLNDINLDSVSHSIDAPIIQDTLNSKFIRIKNNDSFKYYAEKKYPFLKDLNMENVCLAGGFCRSILLKQRMKDFDFFIYGSDDPTKRFRTFVQDLMKKIKEINPEIKFLLMYKPLFNVYEMICIEDPKDFINNEDYNLDYFDKYKMRSMNVYDKSTIIDPLKKEVTTFRENFIEKTKINSDSLNNYFEDHDISGVKMIHRIQFILKKNNDILDVLNSFDLYPSRVAYDGKNVYFTPNAHLAYKYMINVINEKYYSNLFDYRLSKYFSYGFSMVLPEFDIKKIPSKKKLEINRFKCKINSIAENVIYIDHDSNNEEKLETLKKIEERNKEEGISLYTTSLFCSLVSVLRYIKVNKIGYLFTKDIVVPDEQGVIQFYDKVERLMFVDEICSRIRNYDWYGYYRLKEKEETKEKDDEDSRELYFTDIIEKMNKLDEGGKVVVYGDRKVRAFCNIIKDKEFNYVFKGPGSKNVMKQIVNYNPSFENNIITQILDSDFNRRFITFESWDKCFDAHKDKNFQDRHIYEIIRNDRPCKPYLDIEWPIDNLKNEKEKIDQFIEILKRDIVEIFQKRYNLKIKDDDIYILKAHSDKKVSFHVIINAIIKGKLMVFENNLRFQKGSAWDLCYALLNKNKDFYYKKVDELVYTSDREFRTIYSNKTNENRVFIPINQCEDDPIVPNWKKFIITCFDEDECSEIKTPRIYNNQRKKMKTFLIA